MTKHYPADFINAIAEEGTMDESIHHLKEIWNELCQARAEIRALKMKIENEPSKGSDN